MNIESLNGTGWGPIVALFFISLIAGCVAIALFVLKATKFSLNTRNTNVLTKKSKLTNTKQSLTNTYLASAFIDAVIIICVVAFLNVLGLLGEWTNDTLHLFVIVAAILFLLSRVPIRVLGRSSLGERLSKAQQYPSDVQQKVNLIDFVFVFILCFYVISL